MKKGEINGIKFLYRENTSDLKTFEEVIGRDVYRKKGMKIEKGEHWYDCGGNVGAFTLLACSLGAKVTVFEPDPNNCKMIDQNLKLNGFSAQIVCAGLVHNDTKKANLYVGNNGNVWRNSMYKNWNGKGVKVDCVNFDESIPNGACVKIDIEGAEMPILESTKRKFKKLVFEWSFDIDGSLPRFWNIIDKLKKDYQVAEIGNTAKYVSRDYDLWQKSWFPACTNVFCYEKN
jgi:FkbM family methyltransferase